MPDVSRGHRYGRAMRTVPTVLSVVALAGLAAPAASTASKTPTQSQRASLAAYYGAPASCVKTRISTANTRYASVEFNSANYDRCQQYASNGVTIVRRVDGRWRKRYAGSDCSKPSTKRVPSSVWRDLRPSYCGR